MIHQVLFLLLILSVTWADCTSFVISGPTWKNEIKACASGGEHSHTYTFYLGKLSDFNYKYEDIDKLASVIAEGDLALKTGKEGWVPRTDIHLSQTSEASDYKQFRGDWTMESYKGWASQITKMELKVKFNSDGSIYLDIYVSAGSWMSVTCAETKAYVERIRVFLSSKLRMV